MGWGNLDTHISQGGAQIFSHNPAIGELANTFHEYQQKREADNKFLNEQLATNYDPGSLRNDADKAEYYNRYAKIKQAAIDAENEKNPQKRAMAIAEVRQQIGNLNAWAEGSKKQAALDRQLGLEFMKNPDHYENDSVDRYKAGLGKLWDDPEVINNASMVERRPDPDKVLANFKKFAQDQIEGTQWDNGKVKGVRNFDGKTYGTMVQNRGVNMYGDNGAYERALHYASANPDFKKNLNDAYPQIIGRNPQETVALRTLKYMQDNGYGNGFMDKPKERELTGREPVRPSWLEEYYMKQYGAPNKPAGANLTETYRQQWIKDMLSGKPGSGEQLVNKLKSDPNYSQKNELGIKVDGDQIKFTIPDKLKYDAKNGAFLVDQPGRTVSIDKTDPNADIKLNELVNQLTGEKVDISALRTPGGKKHVGVQQKTKTLSRDKLKAMVGRPGYEGYTEQELEDYYKKQGYNIQ